MRLGRRIFTNLRRALTYITAIHIPLAGLALAPILLGLPPLLFPMHVVLMELAIDPICALVFEAEPSEAAAMTRPPRRPDEALFGWRQIGVALAQGLAVLAAVLAVYIWALGAYSEDVARGGAFAALLLGNLTLALADSATSGRLFAPHRRTYWIITAAVVGALILIFSVPAFAGVFKVARPDLRLALVSVTAAGLSGGWIALAVRLRRAFSARKSSARPPLEAAASG